MPQRAGGRQPNAAKPRKVEPMLPEASYLSLVQLVGHGYGSNPTEVARYLLLRSIDDLKRAGVLKPEAPSGQENQGGAEGPTEEPV